MREMLSVLLGFQIVSDFPMEGDVLYYLAANTVYSLGEHTVVEIGGDSPDEEGLAHSREGEGEVDYWEVDVEAGYSMVSIVDESPGVKIVADVPVSRLARIVSTLASFYHKLRSAAWFRPASSVERSPSVSRV